MTKFQKIAILSSVLMIVLAGCSFISKPSPAPMPERKTSTAPSTPKGGGYYKDDGPGTDIPEDLAGVPDAYPRAEPLSKYANRPYTVMGRSYKPLKEVKSFNQTGMASWYGRKFHGRKTASGEVYDMYAMTAAHPTLPIPSYAKVRNPANGREVVVRINDRGPFHGSRVIDLSYTAAQRLGFIEKGSTKVEIEQIVFDSSNQPINAPMVAKQSSEPKVTTAVATLEPDIFPMLISTAMAEESSPSTGSFVQVGAYQLRDNADLMDLDLKIQFDSITGKTQIVQKDSLYRVWIGPFPVRQDAVTLANQISDRYGFKAIVVDK